MVSEPNSFEKYMQEKHTERREAAEQVPALPVRERPPYPSADDYGKMIDFAAHEGIAAKNVDKWLADYGVRFKTDAAGPVIGTDDGYTWSAHHWLADHLTAVRLKDVKKDASPVVPTPPEPSTKSIETIQSGEVECSEGAQPHQEVIDFDKVVAEAPTVNVSVPVVHFDDVDFLDWFDKQPDEIQEAFLVNGSVVLEEVLVPKIGSTGKIIDMALSGLEIGGVTFPSAREVTGEVSNAG